MGAITCDDAFVDQFVVCMAGRSAQFFARIIIAQKECLESKGNE
jgi:hypothetical protein